MDSTDSADSNLNRFEFRVNDKAKRVDDEGDVTRGKRPKRTRTRLHVPVPSSSSSQKITWTPDEELLILEGIVEYERETELSYRSDWDAFYEHSKGFVPKEFTKKQLMSKVDRLHRRLSENLAKAQPSSANTHDAQVFKLSMDIWGHEKAMDLTNLEHVEQVNEIVQQPMDLTHVEHDETINENVVETKVDDSEKEKKKKKKKKKRKVENGEEENKKKKRKVDTDEEEKKKVDETKVSACYSENVTQVKDASFSEQKQADEGNGKAMDLTNLERDEQQINGIVEQPTDLTRVEHDEQINGVVGQPTDVDNVEHGRVTENIVETKDVPNEENGQVNESDKVGEEAICDLQETLEAVPGLGKPHQKFLVQNLKNLDAEDGEELINEWKDLVEEEFHLHMKKLTYSTKLANKIASA